MNLVGKLPAKISGQHFGPQLRNFVLYQYYHAHVTQPLLLEQLREWKIDISAGQLSALITQGHVVSIWRKTCCCEWRGSAVALSMSTIPRHAIKAGMVIVRILVTNTSLGLPVTDSKRRANFLALLRARHDAYTFNEAALVYMAKQALRAQIEQFAKLVPKVLSSEAAWQATLHALAVTNARHIRIVTEGALLGRLSIRELRPIWRSSAMTLGSSMS